MDLQIASLKNIRVIEEIYARILSCFVMSSTSKVPQRVIVQGKAGSAKAVIRAITSTLAAKLERYSFRLLAPTGVSTININGRTIHSALKLFSRQTVKQTQEDAERNFQPEYESVKFIVCDEYSMVGCR